VPLFSTSAGVTRTLVFRVRGGKGRGFFAIRTNAHDAVAYLSTTFNLATGVVATQAPNHVARMVYEGGGWYRCSIQVTPSVGGSVDAYFGFTDLNSTGALGGGDSYLGDPSKGGYVWAYNNYVGPDLGDPPIVQTSALPATRTADLMTVPISLGARFTIFARAYLPALDGVARYLLDFTDGSSNNAIRFVRESTNSLRIEARAGGEAVYTASAVGKVGAREVAVALGYDGATYYSACDGVALASGAGAPPVGIVTGNIGSQWTAGFRLNGLFKRLEHHARCRPPAELTRMTAL